MKPHITLERALRDHNLLGAALGDITSWRTWVAVVKAAFGEALTPEEAEVFAVVAGGRVPPSRRVREAWFGPIGRRSGKSRVAAGIATYVATLVDHSARLVPGELGVIAIIAASREQARTVHSYVKGFLEASPLLAQQIESIGQEEIRLRGNIIISVVTNSYRVARGATLLLVVGDEISFWRDETTALPDLETYRACLPSLVASGGMWVGISTGYRRAGLLFSKHQRHFGQDSDDVLVVSGATTLFNPAIDAAIIDAARAEDPEAAETEWLGGFRTDIAAFLDDQLIEAAIDYGRPLELPPRRDKYRYTAFTDPSGGRHDHFAIAVAHEEKEGERLIIDAVRGARPPFNPQATVAEFALLLKDYGVDKVTGDNYSAAWSEQSFKDCGIKYVRSELPKSQLYLETLPLWTRGLVSIPNHERLVRELRLLERRTHRSGRDTVDHGARGSDDHANVTCGVLALLAGKKKYDSLFTGWDDAPLPGPLTTGRRDFYGMRYIS
jgi:hypothetical protein